MRISVSGKKTADEGRRASAGAAFGNRGFTLIELMVVVIIIGLLAALVAPKLFGKVEQSRVKAAQAQIELLGSALDQFRLDTGRYPSTSEGLGILRADTGGIEKWAGPYIKKEVPADPWGRAYAYTSPGEHDDYDLVSLGADGASGGEGEDQDITSWQGIK